MASRSRMKLPVVACAATLALGAGIVLGDAVESPQANARAASTFEVTPAQLKINQRISQAAVRRSNEALKRLDAFGPTGATSGTPSAPGAPDATGAKGEKGDAGPAGAKGEKGDTGAPGAPGQDGVDGQDATFSAEKWGVIGRNTYGSPAVAFRTGPWGEAAAPSNPPSGVGSLGISVDGRAPLLADREKMAFGNEFDFAGFALDGINSISYSTYTGMDAGAAAVTSPPYLAIEVGEGAGYAALNFVPEPTLPHVWVEHNAAVEQRWSLSQNIGAGGACFGGTLCTLDEVKTALPGKQISFSLGISKGRDQSFQGAVDALEINGEVYDFEPLGVVKK